MNRDTRIALFLMGELVAALRENDPDLFKQLLSGGVQDLGESVVEELLLDWLDPLLTVEEQGRLLGWHLGGEPLTRWGMPSPEIRQKDGPFWGGDSQLERRWCWRPTHE
jgi:hypothetical protein